MKQLLGELLALTRDIRYVALYEDGFLSIRRC